MDPEQSLERVLVVVDHVLVSVFFYRQFFAKGQIDLGNGLLQIGEHLLEGLLDGWLDLSGHCFAEFFHDNLLDGLLIELVRFVLEILHFTICNECLEQIGNLGFDSWQNTLVDG